LDRDNRRPFRCEGRSSRSVAQLEHRHSAITAVIRYSIRLRWSSGLRFSFHYFLGLRRIR
jgi:hypothetical protein